MSKRFGFKLFEMDAEGNLFPLFIDKNNKLPMNKWLPAEYHPTKGFAPRGGWHLGADIPDAPWLKGYDGTDTGCYKSRWKSGKRVWAIVEYDATNDYNEAVSKLKEKCFADRVPKDGYYFFREAGKGTWIISSSIKIVKILTEAERKRIMLENGYDEAAAFAKYKAAMEKRMKISA